MALAGFSHANMFHDNFLGGDYFSPSLFGLMDDNNMSMEVEGMESLMNCNPTLTQLPTFSDSSNSSTGEFEVGSMSSSPTGELSMLSFENEGSFPCTNSSSSMLSFDHFQTYPLIAGMLEQNQINSNVLDWNSVGIPMDMACLGKDQSNWMYSEGDSPCKSEKSVAGTRKRSYMDVNDHAQTYKRQCLGAQRSPKPTVAKDPQSLAAKNRRERISERLKNLQDLVPNGTKVDLVTMLEKAIGYVKFLQLQVKVLATDEFWPANGERTPEVGEVKEAIDAILSSHKDTTLNSSKQQYHC